MMFNRELILLLVLNCFLLLVYELTFGDLTSSRDSNHSRNTIKACIVVLVRNKNLPQLAKTMADFERHFNSKYRYPYVFFNRDKFTPVFKRSILNLTRSRVHFALIPEKLWSVPSWLSKKRVHASLDESGQTLAYRHVSRFYSGFFFRHPAVLKYDYFMRIDDDSVFPCPLQSDPFATMVRENRTYGFVLGARQSPSDLPTLWSSVSHWLASRKYSAASNTLRWISDDDGKSLIDRMCIFYTNFELAAFSVFRNRAYLDYFNHLDRKGGFYYESWGDAPVHTYYVTHMLEQSQVRMFKDVPYAHGTYYNYLSWDKNCSYLQFQECNQEWTNAGYD